MGPPGRPILCARVSDSIVPGPQEGSAELFLLQECGVPARAVEEVMTKAVAWRVTPGGRPLIDRRRRSRVARNMRIVSDYLVSQLCIPPGHSLL